MLPVAEEQWSRCGAGGSEIIIQGVMIICVAGRVAFNIGSPKVDAIEGSRSGVTSSLKQVQAVLFREGALEGRRSREEVCNSALRNALSENFINFPFNPSLKLFRREVESSCGSFK